MNQKIIPALSDMKSFERFLDTNLEVGILMGFHLSQLGPLTQKMKEAKKKTFIHVDLIKGLSADEYGTEYICQTLPIEGIISLHQNVIIAAKKKRKIAVLRMFLIDNLSFNKSMEIVKKVNPDYIEMLPALAYGAAARIQKETQIPIIGGGLIDSEADIKACMDAGMVSITTSKSNLWYAGKNL